MGLAASQARFLCITARKADCEYKSTDLAQQKLEITNQLSDISTEYSNAMNSTKLMWSNDAVDGDYGLTYSLLMMPSAANDFNPYLITTTSGAVVLNSEYAAAAKAAGISKAGGNGSQASRDAFIQALVPNGLVTQETADSITINDFDAVKNTDNTISLSGGNIATGGVNWNPAAGMGAEPKNKSTVDAMTLSDLILSESIGQQSIDWGQLLVGDGETTKVEHDKELADLSKLLTNAKNKTITNDIITQLTRDKNNYINSVDDTIKNGSTDTAEYQNYTAKVTEYENLIANAKKIMAGKYEGEFILNDDGTQSAVRVVDVYSAVTAQIQSDYDACYSASSSSVTPGNGDNGKFNTKENSLDEGTYSVVENGIINHYASEINEMTIGDILSGNIVLMANSNISSDTSSKAKAAAFKEEVLKLFDSISEVFGYSSSEDLTGQGLNVDSESAAALKFAYNMVVNTYLNSLAAIDTGSRDSNKSMTDNSAYINATEYNKIGSDDKGKYYAVSLSNMLSSFLTYYENYITGVDSSYVVGASVETSVYVTDNSSYIYLGQDDDDALTDTVERSADFYDELYNNICEHGWREDSQINDSEYLESAIKDGRYSMASLNNDGYYYQTRYNETGYMVEVSDTDAIARAEAEFTSKKAELTYKEDSIDLKTKQLDAEISTLSTEYDTVKSLISKSIEKTFTMFSS